MLHFICSYLKMQISILPLRALLVVSFHQLVNNVYVPIVFTYMIRFTIHSHMRFADKVASMVVGMVWKTVQRKLVSVAIRSENQ